MKPERPELLFGPYRPPLLRKGDRTACLDRDCDVVITGWSDAPISWPLCRPLERRGGPRAVLVDEELVRAICHESAQALSYWWGVSSRIVVRWRRNQDITRMDSEGSRLLILAAGERGAARVRGKPVPERVRALRRQIAIEKNFAARLTACQWSTEELALLGTDNDEAIAARVGRTEDAVRLMRTRWGILTAQGPAEEGPL
jgi:hypothetical protein